MKNDVFYYDYFYSLKVFFKCDVKLFVKVECCFDLIVWGNGNVVLLFEWCFSDW